MAEESHCSPHDDFDVPEELEAVECCEAGSGIAPERLLQVKDLVEKGNRAFRDNRVDEAVDCYSKAHILKPRDPVILSNRSAAFCRFNRILRERSASDSEVCPLKGLDPTIHAELALKDAEKVVSLRSNSAKSYFLKAEALILLECYDKARDTLMLGFQIDPTSSSLQKSLLELEEISDGLAKGSSHLKLQHCDDFECTLCFKLLYEPVTTPCGHSFCRACLFQSIDHGNKCPLCRTILFISPRTHPISVTLNNIIQKNFPEEYAERKAEKDSLINLGRDIMPLFVMDVVLPRQKLSLNIFEPRYRLMVRRIMEGNHRMGMVVIDPRTGTVADFACEVEITECEPFPDGRFSLEVEARRRFKILQSWVQDGYRVAEVEWIQDILPLEGTPEREEMQQLANRAAAAAQRLGLSNVASIYDRRSEGMPSPQDPEQLSFWLVNLLKLGPLERLNFLRMRDTRERISRMLYFQESDQSCCIQ